MRQIFRKDSLRIHIISIYPAIVIGVMHDINSDELFIELVHITSILSDVSS